MNLHPALLELQRIDKLRIVTDEGLIALACTDWRKRYHTQALAILEPQTTRHIQDIVQICRKHHVAICTQGGNTGLVGGGVPCAEGPAAKLTHVVLKTQGLRETLEIDPHNLTLTASAGYTLQEIQTFAETHGLLFPLSLASEGSCTLGGNLASNAGGVAVLHYGNTRELCLGLAFINSQGEPCGDLRGLRKNNSGYDLRHLLIGSEGTLGIITQACMKVFPMPKSRCMAWLHVENIRAATEALCFIQQRLFNELTSFEWMNANAIALVEQHFPSKAPTCQKKACDHVLVEFNAHHTDSLLVDQVSHVLCDLLETLPSVLNVTMAQNLNDMQTFWAIRENISEAQAKEGLNIKHDVGCPVSKMPQFHDTALSKIEALGLAIRPVLFGHLGDGNLHFNISAPAGVNARSFLEHRQKQINDCVHQAVLAYGGTISAEHGIGQLKVDLLHQVTSHGNYALFMAIKTALDPSNLFNPGKLLIDSNTFSNKNDINT